MSVIINFLWILLIATCANANLINTALNRVLRDVSGCSITEDELQVFRATIIEFYDNENSDAVASTLGCERLFSETINCAKQLKSYLIVKLEESDAEYNRTLDKLVKEEETFLAQQERIPEATFDHYREEVDKINKRILKLQQLIDKTAVENEQLTEDFSYYSDYLSNGTKYSSRFDDDEYFMQAVNCSFRKNSVGELIKVFDNIFEIIVGNSQDLTSSECFDELRFKTANIDNIFQHRTGKDKIESLKNCYADRRRSWQKIYDDYFQKHLQEGRENLATVTDELQKLKQQFKTLKKETEELKKKTFEKGIMVITKMVRSGTRFRKARELYLKLRTQRENALSTILDTIYDCDAESLVNTIAFAELVSKFPGYTAIANKMKVCDQANSPMILKIAYTLSNGDYDINVDTVHQGFASQIRHGNYKKIEDLMYHFGHRVINFPRLFQTMLTKDVKDMRKILGFIDSLHAYDQNIVTILYQEMMKQNMIDTVEHIQFAAWMKRKFTWINQQPTNSAITGDLEDHLLELKKKIPKGIQTFVFDPWVIISTKDFGYLLRSETHNGVKFVAKPDDSGYFYRFQDIRYEKAFYAVNFRDDNTKLESMRVRMGNGNDDSYYWEIIPTDNAEFFYIKNKQYEHYLSSDETNVCVQKRPPRVYEHMNNLYKVVENKNVKWMLIDTLIRNEILPDRNRG